MASTGQLASSTFLWLSWSWSHLILFKLQSMASEYVHCWRTVEEIRQLDSWGSFVYTFVMNGISSTFKWTNGTQLCRTVVGWAALIISYWYNFPELPVGLLFMLYFSMVVNTLIKCMLFFFFPHEIVSDRLLKISSFVTKICKLSVMGVCTVQTCAICSSLWTSSC